MGRTLAVLVWGTLLGTFGCVGPAPALPPETGLATTTSDPTTGIAATGSLDGCTSDEHCSGATPVCDPGSGECVACLPGGGHCPQGEYCDPTILECTVGCDEDSDCPRACDLDAHACVDCIDDGDCMEPTPVCHADAKTCVDCVGDGDCMEPTPVCNADANACVECVVDGDCPTGVCDAGECVSLGFACRDDSVCDTDAGEQCCSNEFCLDRCMVPCTSEADCPAAEPAMQCEHDYCLFPCRSDADCTTWPGFTCLHMGTLCEL